MSLNRNMLVKRYINLQVSRPSAHISFVGRGLGIGAGQPLISS